jgi:hypothetical protein
MTLPAFYTVTRRLWAAEDLKERYPAYLSLMHTMIRATVPVMETALLEARRRAPDDPVAAGVADFLARHMAEEKGHDEWLRQDLAAIGYDPDEPLYRFPSPEVASLVGSQYYWARHYHPVCLLGHGAVLEGYPPHPDLPELIMRKTGYPRSGLRTLSRHTVLDQRHRDQLMAAIDALPLEEHHVTAMGVSALHTVRCMVTIFEDFMSHPLRRSALGSS